MRIARLPSLHATTLHTLYAAHSALYLAPSTIYTLLLARNSLESTLQTRRSTPHTLLIPQSLHELHAALHSPRSRRDPLNSTLHTETLNSTLQTPHRTQYTPTLHIQYSTHLTRNPPRTLYTLQILDFSLSTKFCPEKHFTREAGLERSMGNSLD